MTDAPSRLREHLADSIDRTAVALWSVAHRLRPVDDRPRCPDCEIGLDVGDDCPVCEERREQQRYENDIFEQGRRAAFDAMRGYE